MNIRYKVVEKVGDRYFSCIIDKGKAKVEYKLNKWVKPEKWLLDKRYGLLVFKTLVEAERFRRNSHLRFSLKSIIFKVKCKNKMKLKKYCWVENLVLYGDLREYSYGDWPEGTEMYEQVKLTKQIKEI